jgi:hypothetical protein
VLVSGVPTFNALAPYRDFIAFPASFIGGATVTSADMGSTTTVNGPFNTTSLDGKAEIVVASGPGMKSTVKVFDVSQLTVATPTAIPAAAGSFTPFSTSTVNFQGGASLDVARINADFIPDIVVGAGVNGRSQVDVWAWNVSTSATLASLSANGVGFAAYTDSSRNSPLQVAALDADGDGIADELLAVQGPGGTTEQIREFSVVTASPLVVSPASTVPGVFAGPYFIASIDGQVVPTLPPPIGSGTSRTPYRPPIRPLCILPFGATAAPSVAFNVIAQALIESSRPGSFRGSNREPYVFQAVKISPPAAQQTAIGAAPAKTQVIDLLFTALGGEKNTSSVAPGLRAFYQPASRPMLAP